MSRLLLVEDDERIGSSLQRALTGAGYDVEWLATGSSALAAADGPAPDLLLLDLGLPDADGLDVCRHWHTRHPLLPIVMVTARDEEMDVVTGLDSGAVDYVTKPFSLGELMARIRAHLRLSTAASDKAYDFAGLRLDPASRRAWQNGHELVLRPKEFDLLARLMQDAGRVVTREVLIADVWDENWFGSTKTLDFHIAALRAKVDPPGSGSRITTVRRVGYRFEVEPAE